MAGQNPEAGTDQTLTAKSTENKGERIIAEELKRAKWKESELLERPRVIR
jgi:hypothetical protein